MRGGFAWVGYDLIDAYGKELGPHGLAVYLALCRFAGYDSQQCYIAHRRVTELTGIGRTTVVATLHRLRDLGLIGIEERVDERGQHVNRYTLRPCPRSPGDTPLSVGDIRHAEPERPPVSARQHGTRATSTKTTQRNGRHTAEDYLRDPHVAKWEEILSGDGGADATPAPK
jgi:hypothetical protein